MVTLAPSPLLSQERTPHPPEQIAFTVCYLLFPTTEKGPQESFGLWTDVVHEPRTVPGT